MAELRKQLEPGPAAATSATWEWLGAGRSRGDLRRVALQQDAGSSMSCIWRFPTTLSLVCLALLISILIGVPAGLLLGRFPEFRGWITWPAVLTLVSLSMPSFWLGLMLIILFSLEAEPAPHRGDTPPSSPTSGAGFGSSSCRAAPGHVRLTALLARWSEAASWRCWGRTTSGRLGPRGSRERIVLFRHALRNALIPAGVTVMGINMGILLLAGSAVIETLFVPCRGSGRLGDHGAVQPGSSR
ncbi:MAG: hypothetical protein MZV64_70925 [Ignavibacteriales bacterium]|nr:hypothetical protein [Ignavibacteriales bacterium]